jgi:hypothetical protein
MFPWQPAAGRATSQTRVFGAANYAGHAGLHKQSFGAGRFKNVSPCPTLPATPPNHRTPAMDARPTSNPQTHSAAYFLLEGLNEIGID